MNKWEYIWLVVFFRISMYSYFGGLIEVILELLGLIILIWICVIYERIIVGICYKSFYRGKGLSMRFLFLCLDFWVEDVLRGMNGELGFRILVIICVVCIRIFCWIL